VTRISPVLVVVNLPPIVLQVVILLSSVLMNGAEVYASRITPHVGSLMALSMLQYFQVLNSPLSFKLWLIAVFFPIYLKTAFYQYHTYFHKNNTPVVIDIRILIHLQHDPWNKPICYPHHSIERNWNSSFWQVNWQAFVAKITSILQAFVNN
jgi:hypothetical protein